MAECYYYGNSRCLNCPTQNVDLSARPVNQAMMAEPSKQAPEMAVLMLQKVTRGFLVRKNVKTVKKIEIKVEDIATEIAGKKDVLKKSGVRIEEKLTRLWYKLYSLRRVGDYKNKVIKRVMSLLHKVDSIGTEEEIEDQNELKSSQKASIEVELKELMEQMDRIEKKNEKMKSSMEETFERNMRQSRSIEELEDRVYRIEKAVENRYIPPRCYTNTYTKPVTINHYYN